MLLEGHYLLCVLFVLLLTIILWAIGKVVINMTFGKLSEDKVQIIEKNKQKLCVCMFAPQIIMLLIVFTLGVYIPEFLNNIINCAVAGF